MRLRNDSRGYGVATTTLHWLTVTLLVGQLVIGYSLDTDQSRVFLHAWVGGAILLLTAVRLGWRRAAPLPPWSERLSATDRRLEHRLEQVLYALLFLMPLSGMALLFLSGVERVDTSGSAWRPPYDVVSGDLLLNVHIGSHLALYATVALHVGLALWRGTWRRMV